MASTKKLTAAQARKQVKLHAEKYRQYVKHQEARKGASEKVRAAELKKMDALRPSYTAYRAAYKVVLENGGMTGKAKSLVSSK